MALPIAVLAFYGETDTTLIDSLPEVTAAMRTAGIDFPAKVYENAVHAFFTETNAFMYRADAAADSVTRPIAFLARALDCRAPRPGAATRRRGGCASPGV